MSQPSATPSPSQAAAPATPSPERRARRTAAARGPGRSATTSRPGEGARAARQTARPGRAFAELEAAAAGAASAAAGAGTTSHAGPTPGLGPLRAEPGPVSPDPRTLAAATALARPLETQGVETLRLGVDALGRTELHLRVRCGDALLEARLAEDGAGGVRVALGGSVDAGRLERLAGALAARGHEADLDSGAGRDPGGNAGGGRRREGGGEDPPVARRDPFGSPAAAASPPLRGPGAGGPLPAPLLDPARRGYVS